MTILSNNTYSLSNNSNNFVYDSTEDKITLDSSDYNKIDSKSFHFSSYPDTTVGSGSLISLGESNNNPLSCLSDLSEKSFTYSCWVNFDVINAWTRFVSFASGSGGSSGNYNNIFFAVYPKHGAGAYSKSLVVGGVSNGYNFSHIASNFTISEGAWYNVSFSYESVANQVKIRMLDTSFNLSSSSGYQSYFSSIISNLKNNTNRSYLGEAQWPDPNFKGKMFNPVLFNKVLSDDELISVARGNFYLGTPPSHSSLKDNIIFNVTNYYDNMGSSFETTNYVDSNKNITVTLQSITGSTSKPLTVTTLGIRRYSDGSNVIQVNEIDSTFILWNTTSSNIQGSQGNGVTSTYQVFVSSSGAGGDPYIVTLDNKLYKMHNFEGCSRMIQGEYLNKLLTINTFTKMSLGKDASDSDKFVEDRIDTITNKENIDFFKDQDYFNRNEAFFDKIYMRWGDEHICVDMNDLKIIDNNSGFSISEKFYNSGKSFKDLDIMDHYKELDECSVEIKIGDLGLIVSTINNPQVRSSFRLNNGHLIKNPNGALVNTLYGKDMRLKKITDIKPLTRKNNRVPRRVTQEVYMVTEGEGDRNIKEIPIY